MIIDYVYDVDKCELTEGLDKGVNLPKFMCEIIYDTYGFHKYHQKFADTVYKLFVKSNGKIISFCYLGAMNNEQELKSPYSSPFSLIYLKEQFKIIEAILTIKGIKIFAKLKNINKIRFTLPPDIYNRELINTLAAAFVSEGFKVGEIILNNYFELNKFENMDQYIAKCVYKKKKNNYLMAIKNNLIFQEINIENFERAYNVIKDNHEKMGYPVHISMEQMEDLISMKYMGIRVFVVTYENKDVAASFVFDVTKDISQVIYLGDIFEYRDLRAMDLLNAKLFEFYSSIGKKYLDIGPASEDGIINEGLAHFKKSIGCSTNTKLVLEYIVK